MDDDSPKTNDILPLLESFRLELESGRGPKLESYLAQVAPQQQAVLLRELLSIECRMAGRLDGQPHQSPAVVETYKARFPEFAHVVEAVFADVGKRDVDQKQDELEATIDFVDLLAQYNPLESFDPDLTEIHRGADDSATPQQRDGTSIDQTIDITLAEEDQYRIQQLRQKFESAWQSSREEPNLADFVPTDLDSAKRLILIRDLVSLDIKYRKQKNSSLPPEAYHSRFPDCRVAIDDAFSGANFRDLTKEQVETILTGVEGVRVNASLSASMDASGRYRPMRLHARGGLGAVYRAEDRELKRVVALKRILPEHSGNQRFREKFVFEAEVTGSLEHPGIVPVYGLGRYEDQQPYYAMRFIRGESFRKAIDDFHRRNPTPTAGTFFTREFRSLLRRLIESCNAVHYAHQHGVIHRDLKPDNIMLGNYGETLVVDWGLAKRIATKAKTDDNHQGELEEKPIPLSGSGSQTRYGSAVGTPMYMSPEQASGKHDELDGRTDVYSLGAILFNIVSGRHAVQGKNASEVVIKVRAGKTENLSALAPHAPRALSSICQRAMAYDPADRYATALELADDIDRWIGDDVVTAHVGKEGAMERAGRLIRRYRSWTISGAMALIAIALIATVAALLINHAKEKEKIAKQEATEFKQEAVARYRESRDAIDTWLIQSSDALAYFPSTQSVRQQLLTLAVEDYEKLAQRGSQDPELELERGRAFMRLGDLSQMQEDFDGATSYYQNAMEVLSAEVQDEQVGEHFAAERGNVLTRIGVARSAADQIDEADAAFDEAIDVLTKAARSTDDPLARRYLANALVNQGELRSRLQQHEAAAKHLSEALSQYALLDAQSDDRIALGEARTHELLGRISSQRGDHANATQHFENAVQGLLPLVQARPDHPEFLDALASAYISQATSYRTQGRQPQQLAALQSATVHYRNLCEALPDVPRYQESLAITLTDLGLTHHESGHNPDALSVLAEAEGILKALAKDFPQVPRFREELAGCWDALGQVHLDSNPDPQLASATLADAITVYQRLLEEVGVRADYVERVAIAQSHYARSLWRQGDTDQARVGFDAAISALEDLVALVDNHPQYSSGLAHVRKHYGLMLTAINDASAAQQFELARDLWLGLDQQRTAADAQELAWLLATCPSEEHRDTRAAQQYAGDAVKLSPGNPIFWNTSALIHLLNGDAATAADHMAEVKTLREQPVDGDYFVESMIRQAEGDSQTAAETLQRGVQWMEANRPYHVDMQTLREMADARLKF